MKYIRNADYTLLDAQKEAIRLGIASTLETTGDEQALYLDMSKVQAFTEDGVLCSTALSARAYLRSVRAVLSGRKGAGHEAL